MKRDLWQVDGKVYYQDDGSPASPEDAAEFIEKHKALRKDLEIKEAASEKARKEEEAAFRAKWEPILEEFYGSSEFSEEICSDKKELLYWLATAIFDNDGKINDEMKKLFPDFWEEALAMYERGEHDT